MENTELDSLRDDVEALWSRIRKAEQFYDRLPELDDTDQRLLESLSIINALVDAILFILP